MIEGGYYIKARKIQESEIAFAPPHVREIWDWLIKEVNHKDNKGIKRGSTFKSLKDISEGLKWYVGYRKEMYSKSKCEMSMKWLRKRGMITTVKTTRGMIISICNYDTYQNPKNYETNNEKPTKATRSKQQSPTINKNEENKKNDNNEKKLKSSVAKPTAKKSDFIDLIIETFKESYLNYNKSEYYVSNKGQERSASGKILKIYKEKYPEAKGEETLLSLKTYFDACVKINDGWLRDNMSLSIIISKFSVINKILSNGNQRTRNKPGVSEAEFEEFISSIVKK